MTTTAAEPSTRRFSAAHLILILPWIALVIDAWAPIRDNSFLWHVRAGSLQTDMGAVLTEDPFSFTVLGEPWLTQSWLAELIYAAGERWFGGLGFVPLLMLVLTSITFVAIGVVSRRRSDGLSATALVGLVAVVLLISFLVPRPVVFSFALFGLVLLVWDSPRLRWSLPFIFWLWASVHGSFAIGLGYVGLAFIADRQWSWWPTVGLSGLVTLGTAHGLGVLTLLLGFAEARDTLGLLGEWQRPGITDAVFVPFLVALALIGLGVARRVISLRQLWVIIPFAVLGFSSLRAVPPAFFGLIPSLAQSMRGLRFGSSPRFSAVPAGILGLVVVVLPFLIKGDAELSDTRFPIEARLALEDVPTFHDDRTGGYLIYAEGPEFGVYIDDRAELYGERMAEFVAVRDGEASWEPVFERDGVQQALLPAESDLAADIEASGWTRAYEDEGFVVLRQ